MVDFIKVKAHQNLQTAKASCTDDEYELLVGNDLADKCANEGRKFHQQPDKDLAAEIDETVRCATVACRVLGSTLMKWQPIELNKYEKLCVTCEAEPCDDVPMVDLEANLARRTELLGQIRADEQALRDIEAARLRDIGYKLLKNLEGVTDEASTTTGHYHGG